MDIVGLNAQFQNKTPEDIVEWVCRNTENPILTTSFGAYSMAILHLVTRVVPDIPVIWCDTGYNTKETYRFAEYVIDHLQLNIKVYHPKRSRAHWEAVHGGVPQIDDPAHSTFARLVKLEPFERALSDHQPDAWFANLRKGQTTFRNTLDVATKDKTGILKISPFYSWSDNELDQYMSENGLKDEPRYYDPTKVMEHRECGLHLP
ncbi:phosphoadenylylsulfate reductase [Robertkochia marina]|uniref:Phosphoadenylylsulfate reductase n=1 Tax=Robertkochia marina TaxID=1227945 RepID=A0A4S3M6D1_9FLAO|nr:phosphoadenosine phosphosulfate reductase family protein [Robertkochia marina]THD69961.1 phosphoadenylylsulfate reductase [Robertkochia marina]TRZ46694.1 phosphoadenylylsulfate reductase [Robertkochia marina]